MWRKSHSAKFEGISAEKAWKVWSDVNQWNQWQDDIDYAKMEGEFKAGNTFFLKPKGAPKVKIEILEAVENRGFIDLTKFPFARMYGSHQFTEKNGVLELETSISIEGPLAFLWKKIVAEDIVKKLPEQTAALIKRAGNV